MEKTTKMDQCTPDNTALLIVDVQKGLFNRPAPLYKAENLLANIAHVTDKFEMQSGQIVYIQHSNKKFLEEGSDNWQLHQSLGPKNCDLRIYKSHGNAFKATILHEELQQREITTVVIGGLTTHGCVNATCRGALALGYKVILLADTHSSYHKEADELIEKWNQKLSEEGVVLCSAKDIHLNTNPIPGVV